MILEACFLYWPVTCCLLVNKQDVVTCRFACIRFAVVVVTMSFAATVRRSSCMSAMMFCVRRATAG